MIERSTKVSGGSRDHWISAASVIGLVRRARTMLSPYSVLVITSSATTARTAGAAASRPVVQAPVRQRDPEDPEALGAVEERQPHLGVVAAST